MKKISYELWRIADSVSQCCIKKAPRLFDFSSWVHDTDLDYEIVDCEFKTTQNGDKQVVMYVHEEQTDKHYAIVNEFHEGKWLRAVFKVGKKND